MEDRPFLRESDIRIFVAQHATVFWDARHWYRGACLVSDTDTTNTLLEPLRTISSRTGIRSDGLKER